MEDDIKRTLSAAPALAQLPRAPFCWLPEASLRGVFFGSMVLTVILMAAIHVTNAPLQNPAAPMGMVSLQLAGSLAAAEAILASWGPAARGWAILNLGIDYPYLLAYATTLGLACLLLARQFVSCRYVALSGVLLSWGVMVAMLLDAVENGLLLRLLLGDLRESWAVLAFWCAVPKYALVLAALAYLGVGGLVCLVRKVAAA
jgi:hypothetical protein